MVGASGLCNPRRPQQPGLGHTCTTGTPLLEHSWFSYLPQDLQCTILVWAAFHTCTTGTPLREHSHFSYLPLSPSKQQPGLGPLYTCTADTPATRWPDCVEPAQLQPGTLHPPCLRLVMHT